MEVINNILTLSNTVPSLHIGRVHSNITEKMILSIFISLNIGKIKKINIIRPKEKESKFNRVIINLLWYNNEKANSSRERLLRGNEIKIIYDDPWFWKVNTYNPKKKEDKNILTEPEKNNKYLYDGMIPPLYMSIPIAQSLINNIVNEDDIHKSNLDLINPYNMYEDTKLPIVKDKIEKYKYEFYLCEDDRTEFEIVPSKDIILDYGNIKEPPNRKTKIPLK